MSVTIPPIAQLQYSGESRLAFDVRPVDLITGSKQLATSGVLRWATNLNHWHIAVTRGAWSQPAQMDLEVAADGPWSAWHSVDQQPSAWISGNDGSVGAASGIRWRVADFGPALQPGFYETAVYFSLIAE